MDIHFATAWEAIADAVPDAPALACGDTVRTWRAFDERASRLASALASAGLGAGARVATYLHNSNEYLEVQFAAFKLGGCPVNLSHRYKADDLVRLLDHADAAALVYPSRHSARIWEIQKRLPKVQCFVEVADGTENIPVKGRLDYETALRTFPPLPRAGARSAEDLVLVHTAGATGRPKGVLYRHGDLGTMALRAAFAAMDAAPPADMQALQVAVRALHAAGSRPVSLPASPLMHVAGMWLGAMVPLIAGGSVVTLNHPALEPELVWEAVAQHRVTDIAVAGDFDAVPLLAALDAAEARGEPHDLRSLRRISSTGVPWRPASKLALLARHDLTLVDVLAAAEGVMGVSVATRASWRPASIGHFAAAPGVRVFADDGSQVQPGSRQAGRIAVSASLPVGYPQAPDASATTFRDADGVRHGFPGDYARVDVDGALEWLGRGSESIEVAGERVFAEMVEAVLKTHPDVRDCLVVGLAGAVAGEGAGEGAKVVALVSMAATGAWAAQDDDDDGAEAPYDEGELLSFVRNRITGPGAPSRILHVPQVRRAPGGSPDYAWARQEVQSQLT